MGDSETREQIRGSGHLPIEESPKNAPEPRRPARTVVASLRPRKEQPMPPVRFRFRHRAASTVAVAGDFNRWSTAAHPLERETDEV